MGKTTDVVKFTDATHLNPDKDYTIDQLMDAVGGSNAKMYPADSFWAIKQGMTHFEDIIQQLTVTGKTAVIASYGHVSDLGAIDFDFSTEQVTIPESVRAYFGFEKHDLVAGTVPFSTDSGINMLLFNKTNKSMRCSGLAAGDLKDDDYLVAVFVRGINANISMCNGRYTVNGLPDNRFNVPIGKTAVCTVIDDTSKRIGINFNFDAETVELAGTFRVYYDNIFAEIRDTTLSYGEKEDKYIKLVYDLKTGLQLVGSNSRGYTSFTIAIFDTYTRRIFWCNGPYMVNGDPNIATALTDKYLKAASVVAKRAQSVVEPDYANSDKCKETGGGLIVDAGGYCFPRFNYLGNEKSVIVLRGVNHPEDVSCAFKTDPAAVLQSIEFTRIDDGLVCDLSNVTPASAPAEMFVEIRIDNRKGTTPLTVSEVVVGKDGYPMGQTSSGGQSQTVYVDGSVSATGTGDKTAPYKTITEALATTAETIIVTPGDYAESVIIKNRPKLTITSGSDHDFLTDTKPLSKGINIIGGTKLSAVSKDGLLYHAEVYAETARIDKVFVAKSLPLEETSSTRSEGYNVTLWDDDTSTKMVPVLTKAECTSTSGSFTYDGTGIWINGSASSYTLTTLEDGVTINDCGDIRLDHVCVSNTYNNNFSANNVANVEFNYCEAHRSGLNNGFGLYNASGKFTRCEADHARNDGFNFHGFGTTHALDCYGHDNYDDGISHHDGCEGTVDGGQWLRNKKGGVSSPTYGAIINIANVYCSGNNYGIYADARSQDPAREIFVQNSVLLGNAIADIMVADKYTMHVVNSNYATVKGSIDDPGDAS